MPILRGLGLHCVAGSILQVHVLLHLRHSQLWTEAGCACNSMHAAMQHNGIWRMPEACNCQALRWLQ